MTRSVLKAEVIKTPNAGGGTDVTIRVPLMQLKGQVSEVEWRTVLTDQINKKYRDVKNAIFAKEGISDDQKLADWTSFVNNVIAHADEKELLKDQKTIRGRKTDASERAYKIAERYGAHLYIPWDEDK